MNVNKYIRKDKGINMENDMRTWKFTNDIIVEEEAFDYDLHIFAVYHKDRYLGRIYPCDIDAMRSCIKDLDAGKDPITEKWEDGCGNTCSLDGWGED